jgi:hypothetical protein
VQGIFAQALAPKLAAVFLSGHAISSPFFHFSVINIAAVIHNLPPELSTQPKDALVTCWLTITNNLNHCF